MDVCATSFVFVLSVVCLVSVLGVAVSVDSLGTGGSSLEGLANICNWIGGFSKCCTGMMLHAQLPMGGL